MVIYAEWSNNITVQLSMSLMTKSIPLISPYIFTSLSPLLFLNIKSSLLSFFFFLIEVGGAGRLASSSAALMMVWKSDFRDAPPTRKPSMFGCLMSDAALDPETEPPY